MSRRRLPRRLACVLMGAALFGFAAPAWAQALGVAHDTPDARTIYGSRHTQSCGNAAARSLTTDEAVADCTQALDEQRGSRAGRLAVFINRGVIYLHRHEGQSALADFEAALAIDPRNAEAMVNRGQALIMVGQPGQAVAAITQALTYGVREPHKAYYTRGAARETLGDLRGAYEDYSTALEIEPDWGPAEAELARFVRVRRERLASALGAAAPPNGDPNGAPTTEGSR